MTVDATTARAIELVHDALDAARQGDVPTLEALLDAGVPLEVRSPAGDSLLMLASYHGHAGATRALLARGADPEAPNARGQRPLAGAAFKGDVAIVQALLAEAHRSMAPAPTGARRCCTPRCSAGTRPLPCCAQVGRGGRETAGAHCAQRSS